MQKIVKRFVRLFEKYIYISDTFAKNFIFNPYKIGLGETHGLQTRVRV